MDDLISRQAAIDLCDWYDNPSMHDDLEKLPTAQPELIRCKDCKHFATINEPYNETFCRLCFMNKSEMGYCDKAERRTDDEGRSDQLDN